MNRQTDRDAVSHRMCVRMTPDQRARLDIVLHFAPGVRTPCGAMRRALEEYLELHLPPEMNVGRDDSPALPVVISR